MFFTNFYGQPSCTPGRAAIQTGRIPNRSGMTTVAFQGQGGGLPHAEWTLGSVLKKAGYGTYFTGKWHLGEADYALPNAQGYDEMKYVFRDGQPIIFDSYDMTPVWEGTGKSKRNWWFYFTEDELSPGAVRLDQFKYALNILGDDGADTGALAVDTNLGWKGASKYVATVPQVFDLLQDPQEHYDIFMTTFTESTWAMVPANESVAKLMKTYVKYPPRKLQSETYTGPITISKYQHFETIRKELEKQGFSIGLPTGN